MVVGRKFVGEVAELGADVSGISSEQSVSAESHITRGQCRNCRGARRGFCRDHKSVGVTPPGAFAEFLTLPAANIVPIPDHIPNDIATILDPLGTQFTVASPSMRLGEDVLITWIAKLEAGFEHRSGSFPAIEDTSAIDPA